LDFTYIQDLLDGLTRIIETEESRNQIFNLTYGAAHSIADMLNILLDYFPGILVRSIPKDALIPDRGTLSVEKARLIIGYEPRWPLDKGYPKYIEWYKDFFGRHPDMLQTEGLTSNPRV